MKQLSKKHILALHRALINEFGGQDGVRDEGLLESAISTPFQTFAGQELYPSLIDKGVRLGYGLIKNHPFFDGNKRIGTHAMLVFLQINGIALEYTQEELLDIILAVADGSCSAAQLSEWIHQHCEGE